MSHCVFLDFGIVEMNFLEGYILLSVAELPVDSGQYAELIGVIIRLHAIDKI